MLLAEELISGEKQDNDTMKDESEKARYNRKDDELVNMVRTSFKERHDNNLTLESR